MLFFLINLKILVFRFLTDPVKTNLTSGNLENFRKATPFLDTFTTGIFFAAMWLMALKKIENWTLWIIGNIVLKGIEGIAELAIQTGKRIWEKNLRSKLCLSMLI